ncbi:molybdenum cofactor biosynthesis protein MoaE [Corynebacterium simulans]|uniref:Molybdopterin converting factor n=1 Tax=Corynebacterium accolens TaxID=38284 RepID=A0A2A4AKT8_9CORY|nr:MULTISPECIES: molybdenum cofactor biosynthesis protein MoaE [Corynebacterium]PCC83014.1 molybdopterin converting factor [Corynebacterium accolens]MCG7248226.1 molybdenum cofactor biosynthesis protein MoaE [Corynebacterium simulans]OFQ44511.1 molybdopterin converting factor [Corynebacterium sp. HMSC076D02]OFR40967.1 molybdopterin converting factor [Corynebacterium sp. HMSC077D03]OFT47260.1 molybdopterin converting factor [Corynebacterium sp. HMSC06G04]
MSTDPAFVSADTGKVIGAMMTSSPIEKPDISTPAMGAVVTFDGIVRNHDGGRGGVELLRYTAHPTAESEISRVAQEVIAAHPNTRLWCAHRTGDLRVGEAAFVVIAAAAHRGDAFAAAEECANRVKAEVPIWKEQRYADGFSNWVGLE